MNTLNQAQLDILKLFQVVKSEQDIAELKKILVQFLAQKTVIEADKAFDLKAYTQTDLLQWKDEHFRTTQQE